MSRYFFTRASQLAGSTIFFDVHLPTPDNQLTSPPVPPVTKILTISGASIGTDSLGESLAIQQHSLLARHSFDILPGNRQPGFPVMRGVGQRGAGVLR